MTGRLEGIRRGRMSPAEKAEIDRLALSLREPTPGRIARRINRHPATVAWYMIAAGIIKREVRYAAVACGRRHDGVIIQRYTKEQDDYLIALARTHKKYREIAEAITAEFGIVRSPGGVKVRLAMLAAYRGGEDAR
jgi:hypothetical protein